MNIYIAGDHRAFDQKQKLVSWLQLNKYTVIDCGNTRYEPLDDYSDFAFILTHKMNPEKDKGIAMCGSGVGVSIAINRIKKFRCVLGFNRDQIKHAVENDHCNVLALASDYFDVEKLKSFIEIFLNSQPKTDEKYIRRITKLDTY